MAKWAGVWKQAGPNREITSLTTTRHEKAVQVSAAMKLPAGESTARYDYSVHGNGAIDITAVIDPKGEKLPALPRIGMMMGFCFSVIQVSERPVASVPITMALGLVKSTV